MNPDHKSRSPNRPSRDRHGLFPFFAAMIGAGLALVSVSAASAAADPASDWPAWRGPTRDGIAASGQNPPVQWSETGNILWKAPIPGRGHGSPTVVADRIYLATADRVKQSQSVLCLDRHTGKLVWQTAVHGSHADPGKHSNSSAASSTVTCDGERLFINFLNDGSVHTTALDLAGKVLWQRKICDFVTHQGFASSPVIHESLVLVSADNKGGGVIAGLDRKTGRIVWSESRPKLPKLLAQNQLGDEAYASPVICGGRIYLRVARRGDPRQEFLYCVGNSGGQAQR